MSYIRKDDGEPGEREMQLFLDLRATQLTVQKAADRDRIRGGTPGLQHDSGERNAQNPRSDDLPCPHTCSLVGSNFHFTPLFSSAVSNCSSRLTWAAAAKQEA